MLMDGVEILEKTPIYNFGSMIDFIAIIGILISFLLIFLFSVNGKIKLSIIFSVIFLLLFIYEGNKNMEISKYKYKIEIQDYSKIDMAEFSDKYEIIEIDGNVWTIEGKKVNK